MCYLGAFDKKTWLEFSILLLQKNIPNYMRLSNILL